MLNINEIENKFIVLFRIVYIKIEITYVHETVEWGRGFQQFKYDNSVLSSRQKYNFSNCGRENLS